MKSRLCQWSNGTSVVEVPRPVTLLPQNQAARLPKSMSPQGISRDHAQLAKARSMSVLIVMESIRWPRTRPLALVVWPSYEGLRPAAPSMNPSSDQGLMGSLYR